MFLPNRRRLGVRLVFALGAMALFVLGYQWGNQQPFGRAEPAQIHGVLVQPPGAIPAFSLRDPFGRPVGRAELADGWTLLAFGDLAEASGQRAAQRLIETRNRLADQSKLIESLQLVLIQTSERLEPARDFARLSPALRLLAGPPESIAPLRDALGLASSVGPTLFVIGPEARLLAILPETESGAEMAEDIKTLIASQTRF
ncbi:MAG: hypothetical protein MZV65_10195 [Chromatiales bacterium]|nr:hypothetical protein [Chromatiales bacterium]